LAIQSIIYNTSSIKPRQPLRTEELGKGYMTSADTLHIDGLVHHEATSQAARWMKETGKTVVMDGSKTNGTVGEQHCRLIPHVDGLIAGEG